MSNIFFERLVILVVALVVLGAGMTVGKGAVDQGYVWITEKFGTEEETVVQIPPTSCIGTVDDNGNDIITTLEDHEFIEERLRNSGCGELGTEDFQWVWMDFTFKSVQLDVVVTDTIWIEQDTCFDINEGNNVVDPLTQGNLENSVIDGTIARFYDGSRNNLLKNRHPMLYEGRTISNDLRITCNVVNANKNADPPSFCKSDHKIKYSALSCGLEPGKYRYVYYYRVIDNNNEDEGYTGFNPYVMKITSLD